MSSQPKKRFSIPGMRKANGRKVKRSSKSGPHRLDTWGCNMEPGKYFGRFPHDGGYFHVYGSWWGDSVTLHRDDDRDGPPVAQSYFTPSKAWWTQPFVYGTAANRLIGLHDSFTKWAKTHPELKNLSG